MRDGDVLTETEQQPNVNVPEPSVLLLMMTGLLAIVGRRKFMFKL
ncbi:MAG: PEP-CTERM sorting domain-containing protein [Candidatus Thiodiazotropha endolucinida]